LQAACDFSRRRIARGRAREGGAARYGRNRKFAVGRPQSHLSLRRTSVVDPLRSFGPARSQRPLPKDFGHWRDLAPPPVRIFERGTPVRSIVHVLHAPDVVGADFFVRPETRLTNDQTEQAAIDALDTATSWSDANTFIALLSVHCSLSLLAAFDVCITEQLSHGWIPKTRSAVMSLFPQLASRAQTDSGRPTRRGGCVSIRRAGLAIPNMIRTAYISSE
jgi:hypothetical protein